jgi:hypothetical protein
MFSSLIIFKDLLKNSSLEEQTALVNFLSDKMKQQVEAAPSIFVPLDPDKFFLENLLYEIHYSWLVPFFESFSPKDRDLFLHSLNEPLSSKIKNHFNILKSEERPSAYAQKFLKELIFNYILEEKKDLLPKEYLPDSELNLLLDFSKNELILLFDYLALYDLAIQKHKILDPKILKKIDLYLDEDKKLFLKSKITHKENFSFPSLKLDAEDSQSFLFVLHKRGLNRFAKALSDQDANLIWYLAHTLDAGRGKALMKFSKETAPKEIITSIASNIIELIPIIKAKAKKATA